MVDSDGLEYFPASHVFYPHDNVRRVRNEFSPFGDIDGLNRLVRKRRAKQSRKPRHRRAINRVVVDTYWGHAYDSIPDGEFAIYGRTEDIPVYGGEDLGRKLGLTDMGYLRVPFRRIPRFKVESRDQIDRVINCIRSADDDIRVYFRGQNREFSLPRSEAFNRKFYGEDSVIEPSLPTSATRRKYPLEEVLPEWSVLVQHFMKDRLDQLAEWAPLARVEELRRDWDERKGSALFSGFALAIAQHYGLPSSGLDISESVDVALFFALMRYRTINEFEATFDRVGDEHIPVVYLLAPRTRVQLSYDEVKPIGFPPGRPDSQNARFMHTSWGLSRNECARRLWIALYLDPQGDYGEIPTASSLFPSEDQFSDFLLEARNSSLPSNLKKVLDEHFRVVVPA